MLEIKETAYKGTRIIVGNEKRDLINTCILHLCEFTEISIPIIQHQSIFSGKVGEENNNLMFNFTDRGGRDLCLAPEYTAVVQKLAHTTFKNHKNVGLFYVQECFRGEKPQKGRYRQFTQLGVEVINPTDVDQSMSHLIRIAASVMDSLGIEHVVNAGVRRGLDYYNEGSGFEIHIPSLGSCSQVCGGGSYDGGVGFAIGIDRLLLAIKK